MKRLILIDSHAIIHRAYHAIPPLTSPLGEPTNAVYGFTTILLRILRELKPDYIAAAFDLAGPTFRHVAYERYKAQRHKTPSDLSSQFGKTREILEAHGIPVFEKLGFEADDIIGTIAKKVSKNKNIEVLVVTGDLDALQLVRPGLKVYTMKKGITETIIYDVSAVLGRFGINPKQTIDFKGLKGDPSDNIPGVRGIGEKTATELIQAFGSIEGVYSAIKKGTEKISERVKEKLKEGEENARFSRELATINCEVPIEFSLEKTSWQGGRREPEIMAAFQKFGFFSLMKRFSEEKKEVSLRGLTQETLPETKPISSGIKKPKRWSEIEGAVRKDFPAAIFLHDNIIYLCANSQKEVFEVAKGILISPQAKKFFSGNAFLAHDGKTIVKFLRTFNIELGKIEFDSMIAAHLTGSLTRDFSYLSVVGRELGRMTAIDPVQEFVHFFEVAEALKKKLQIANLEKIFFDIELPVSRILADMEERGILLDSSFLKSLSKNVGQKITHVTQAIHSLAGTDFNISSPKQLSVVLFEKLAIRPYGLKKTEKGGVVSTRESELEKLKGEHPIISEILRYRELVKLKTTYIDTLPKLVRPKTGRLHTTFNQTGTVTGRLSSSNPNLQNIPVMSEFGKEVRRAFVAESGFLLVSFDYSQIELRVAAHLAGDKKMIEAFQKGLDIHSLTASEVYNIPLEQVTPELRRAAKTLNFGVLYGMGAQAFSGATGMSQDDAKKFIREYFEDFSGIAKYITATKEFAQTHGYVETLFGRRRHLPEINSSNWQVKREAERMAVNMPIQGTATGDIVKMAMIKVEEWVEKEGLEDKIRMLLQVHDELVFEIEEKALKHVAPQIKDIMESVAALKVPLVVDVKAGKNWGEQKKIG